MTEEEWKWYMEKCKVPNEFKDIVQKYRKSFGQTLAEIGSIPEMEFTIELRVEKDSYDGQWRYPRPFYTEPYKQTEINQKKIEEQTKQELKYGIIKPSINPGPYQASCTAVLKKPNLITGERETRIARDYVGLNANTVMKGYPIPNIQRIVKNMSQWKKFVCIDITSAYFHIPVRQKDQELLAFAVSGMGRFIPTVMPFGPKGAPSVFGAAMQKIFGDLYTTGWFAQYFDDLAIGANNIKELKERVAKVFERIRANNLTIKLTKCEWLKEEINLLGWKISNGKLRIQDKNIEAITKWKLEKETIPSLMGLLNYMTSFIPRLAELAKPIREVFQNKRKIDDEIVLKNFKIIQQIITQDPYLKMIEPRKPIKIQTDASEKATGAVLLQQDNKEIWIPRGYYSYTFTPTEQKWNSTVRKEAKAIANAIKHFQKDLPIGIGQIIIETDSNTLVNMLKQSKQHQDQEVAMAQYRIGKIIGEINHIRREENILADSLSKNNNEKQKYSEIDRLLVGILDNEQYKIVNK